VRGPALTGPFIRALNVEDHLNLTRNSEQLNTRSAFSIATAVEAGIDERSLPLRSAAVRLLGTMKDMGFAESQWLIERNGEYIQVSELLYRIVELADGQHTLREVADGVTSSTDWIVEPEDVENLVNSKLVPLGIIGSQHCEQNTSQSPLDLNLRCKTITPRFLNPFTQIFKYMCTPAVLSLVLASSVAGHWWLYRHHGIKAGFQDALYTPGGLLAVIALIFLGAAFHELGHASALRYHGGNVGGMGVGVYLIYPVFYTDATDAYRLSRLGRLAVDLGGVYFHLIFGLALFAAYFKTHHELLLFSVFLVDLEICRQFIPLIRLDGYWALTDLTGIPDLFSQILPFLKSLFPSLDLKSEALPKLKKWVAALYLAYLAVAIPLLGYFFLMMIVKFPELVSTTRSALHTQIGALMTREVLHSPGAAFLVSFQIVLLLVPIAGTVYLVFLMLKGPLWNFVDWTARTPRHAAMGLTSAVAVCGVAAVVVIFPPTTLVRHFRSTPPKSIIAENQDALNTAETLRAKIEGTLGADHFTGTVLLKKPNLARVEVNGSGDLGHYVLISNGEKETIYFQDDNEYVEGKPGTHGEQINAFVAEQVSDFFQPALLSHRPNVQATGRVNDHNDELEVVTYRSSTQFVRYYISNRDKLAHRVLRGLDVNQPTASATMSEIEVNAPIDSEAFAWKLPSTAKPAQMPANFTLPVR
jgi:outer membrane lipoprotein-sorting protein